MSRPKRLYKTKTGRTYYLIKGKRKYLKKDAVIPKKGGITINIRNIIQKKPKKYAPRKKTAFALNPKVPLQAGLPIHLPVEQKSITQIEDVIKGEVKKKNKDKDEKKNTSIVPFEKSKDYKELQKRLEDIENQGMLDDAELIKKVGRRAINQHLRSNKGKTEVFPSSKISEISEGSVKSEVKPKSTIMGTLKSIVNPPKKAVPAPIPEARIKKKIELKPPKSEKDTLPASVRINKKAKYNIDTLFDDFSGKYGAKDEETWKAFQNSKQYFMPIQESDELYKSRPPFVYDYIPKFIREKRYKGETTSEESGDEIKKRNIEKEKEEEISPFEVSSDEEKLIKERAKKKPAKREHKIATTEEKDETGGYESEIEGRGASGLYNSDIEDIMKGLKNICPVITSDKINMLLDYVKSGMKKFGAIINTNPSTSDGSGNDGYRVGHWRAVFFDNDEDGKVSAEFFDPLCEGKISPQLKKIMTKIASKMNPEDYSLVKENHLKRQMDTTNTCGYHCIKFIDDRYNDIPWSEATGYDDYMAKHKPDDSISGEKDLIGPIKKYDKFI